MNHLIRKKSRIRIPLLITLIALALCLSLGATALVAHAVRTGRTAGGVTVLTRVDSELLLGQIDGTVDCFNTPEVFWTADEAVTLTAPDSLPTHGEQIFEGSRSLLVSDAAYRPDVGTAVRHSFSEAPASFPDSRFFTFSLFLPNGSNGKVTATIRSSITVDGETEHRLTFEQSAAVTGGSWHTILMDISTFLGRTGVREIEIMVESDPANEGEPFEFALDAVGFSTTQSPENALRFLSDSYIGGGCTLTYGETLTVSSLSSVASFMATDLPTLTLNRESALCVALINEAGFRTLRCEYTDADTRTVKQSTQTLESSPQSIQYCYFPIDADSITSVTFRLEGGSRGDLTILSITPVSWLVSRSESLGTLTACTLDQTKKELQITGSLNSGIASRYANGQLRLYEMELYQDLDDLVAGRCKALANRSVDAAFSFSVSTSSPTDLLMRSFAVALVKDGDILPISEPIHLQNPALLASYTTSLPTTQSKKGFSPITETDIFDGITYTAIPVRLEELLTLDRTAYSVITDHIRYYYREEVLTNLDSLITLCKRRGIRATLVLTVSPSQDAALNRILLHPSADPSAPYCAFNTATADGLRYLRAAVDMLARRYPIASGDQGGLSGFVVGQNVNNTEEHYSMGDVTLLSFVSEYATALRLVHHTVAAVNPSLTVHASFDCTWNSENTRRAASRFGTRQVLDLLNHLITARGDFGWRLAYDPYPQAEYYAFEDASPTLTPEAEQVTLSNLEVLTAYFMRSPFYYDRQYRSILLLEQTKQTATEKEDAGTIIKQSADYVYGYYKISTRNFPLVQALIVCHDVNYNETLRYIDTEHSTARTSYALEVLHINDWSAYLTAFELSAVITRSLTENQLTHATPSSVVGEMPLWTFENKASTQGWQAGQGVIALVPGTSIGENYYLSVLTSPTAVPTDYREILLRSSQSYDFTPTPFLRFNCTVSGLPEEITLLELSVAVMAGEDCLRADTVLRVGESTTVVVDMHDFSGLSEVDCIRILLRSTNDEDIGSPTLLIGQIDGLSDRYAGDILPDRFEEAQKPGVLPQITEKPDNLRIIIILCTIILSATILEIVRIAYRRHQSKA